MSGFGRDKGYSYAGYLTESIIMDTQMWWFWDMHPHTFLETLQEYEKGDLVMIATKDEERKVLEQIRRLIDGISGTDSYIGAALEGCLEIAEENIRNDWLCSMKQKFEAAEKNVEYYKDLAEKFSEEVDELRKENKELEQKLDKLYEWKDFTKDGNLPQEDYDALFNDPDIRVLTNEQAKEIVCREFGFVKEWIEIVRSVPTYQINRFRQLRQAGTKDRRPLYSATDMNYIRFNCCGMQYELYNGDLSFYK